MLGAKQRAEMRWLNEIKTIEKLRDKQTFVSNYPNNKSSNILSFDFILAFMLLTGLWFAILIIAYYFYSASIVSPNFNILSFDKSIFCRVQSSCNLSNASKELSSDKRKAS